MQAGRAGGVPGALARWLGPAAGVAVIGLLVARLGRRPFLDALAVVDVPTLAAALVLGVATTVLSVWRWSVVAERLGVALAPGRAVADYYRALFLNAVLPGGVLGDVHRAVVHGRDRGDVRRCAAAVAVERAAGQAVLVVVVAAVALGAPDAMPLPVPRPLLAGVAVAAAAAAVLVVRRRLRSAGLRAVRDLGALAAVTAASLLVVAGYVVTFLLAARAAGITAPVERLVPLVLLALLAMALPLNVGGWGPREGAAAWAFGAAGVGASDGVTASVVYGVCVLVAALPGAVVVVASRFPRRPRSLAEPRRRAGSGAGPDPAPVPAPAP